MSGDDLFDELAKHRWAVWLGWCIAGVVLFVLLSVVTALLSRAGEWLVG